MEGPPDIFLFWVLIMWKWECLKQLFSFCVILFPCHFKEYVLFSSCLSSNDPLQPRKPTIAWVGSEEAWGKWFSALMTPHLEYCIQIWGSQNKKDIDPLKLVQRRVMRLISTRLLRELGLFSLDKRPRCHLSIHEGAYKNAGEGFYQGAQLWKKW